MTHHAPGPWELGNAVGAGRNYTVCAGPVVIARISGNGYPIGKGSAPESDANARLIAAAPDLLAACRLLVDSHTKSTDAWPSIIAAQAAIAKVQQP
jgi:hypothetical protein